MVAWVWLAIAMYSSYRGSYKPGPWTGPCHGTGLWTGLKTFRNEEFCGLLNSLQVPRGIKKSLGPAV